MKENSIKPADNFLKNFLMSGTAAAISKSMNGKK
jgi:hypothetical protein